MVQDRRDKDQRDKDRRDKDRRDKVQVQVQVQETLTKWINYIKKNIYPLVFF